MKRAVIALLLLCAASVTSYAQPTTIAWRPPIGCTNGQSIAYNTSTARWECGTFASTAGAGLLASGSTWNVVATTGGGLTVAADSLGLLTSCSSGEVLKWSGSAWACATDDTLGGGAVTGTGTSGTMTKWTGTSTVGDSLLTDNATTLSYASGKLTVAAASGNTTVAGTFAATGAITDGGNRVFSVTGSGLTSTTRTVTLALSAQDCAAGSFFDSNTTTGAFTCVAEVGDITEVTAGAGLTGTSTTGPVALDIVASSDFSVGADLLDLSTTVTMPGSATVATTLGVTGNFAVNTNKFTVDASNGATDVAGYVAVDTLFSHSGGLARIQAAAGGGFDVQAAYTQSSANSEQLRVSESNTYRGSIGYDESASTIFVFDNSFADATSAMSWRFGNTEKLALLGNGNLTAAGDLHAVGGFFSGGVEVGAAPGIGGGVGVVSYGDNRFGDLGIGGAAPTTEQDNYGKFCNLFDDTHGFCINAISASETYINTTGQTVYFVSYGGTDITMDGSANMHVGGAFDATGLVTATAGGTTGNNWTTTGTGDLVSGDDLTVADDAFITGTLDVDDNLSKFGAADGAVYFNSDTINGDYSVNGTGGLYFNFTGYNLGTSQFRDAYFYNGKAALVATFAGSDKSLAVVGNVSTNANLTAGDTAASDTFTANATSNFNYQIFAGDTASSSIANNLDVLTIGNTGTGQTSSLKKLIAATNSGSYDTTAGIITADGISSVITATRSAGASNLINRAARFSASGGQQNIAIETTSGEVIFSGDLTTAANVVFGDAITDTTTATGPLTALRITPDTQIFDHTRGTEIFNDFTATPVLVSSTVLYGGESGFLFGGGFQDGSSLFTMTSNHPGVLGLRAYTSAQTITVNSVSVNGPRYGRVIQGMLFANGGQGDAWFAGGGVASGAVEAMMPSGVLQTTLPLDDSDSVSVHLGLFDYVVEPQATADYAPNGIYCRAGTGSSNWQVCTAKADTHTCVDTSPTIAIALDKWIRCEFTVNAGGTSVTFTVTNITDATSGTATNTTNIPNTSSNLVGLGASIDSVDNNGTGLLLVDYAWFDQTFTTAR